MAFFQLSAQRFRSRNCWVWTVPQWAKWIAWDSGNRFESGAATELHCWLSDSRKRI